MYLMIDFSPMINQLMMIITLMYGDHYIGLCVCVCVCVCVRACVTSTVIFHTQHRRGSGVTVKGRNSGLSTEDSE